MKTKDFVVSVLTIILLHVKLISQTVEPSKGVDKNNLQFEFETLYSVEREPLTKTTSWDVPNVLIRYGLSKNIELQLHTPFTNERCFENVITSYSIHYTKLYEPDRPPLHEGNHGGHGASRSGARVGGE